MCISLSNDTIFVMILQGGNVHDIRIRGRVKSEKLQNTLVSNGIVMQCSTQ